MEHLHVFINIFIPNLKLFHFSTYSSCWLAFHNASPWILAPFAGIFLRLDWSSHWNIPVIYYRCFLLKYLDAVALYYQLHYTVISHAFWLWVIKYLWLLSMWMQRNFNNFIKSNRTRPIESTTSDYVEFLANMMILFF